MPLGVPVQTRGETLPKKLKSLIDNVELVLFPPQAYILNVIAEVTFDKEDKFIPLIVVAELPESVPVAISLP